MYIWVKRFSKMHTAIVMKIPIIELENLLERLAYTFGGSSCRLLHHREIEVKR